MLDHNRNIHKQKVLEQSKHTKHSYEFLLHSSTVCIHFYAEARSTLRTVCSTMYLNIVEVHASRAGIPQGFAQRKVRAVTELQQQCTHNVLILGYFPREAVLEYSKDAHRGKCLEIVEMNARKCLNIVEVHACNAGIQQGFAQRRVLAATGPNK